MTPPAGPPLLLASGPGGRATITLNRPQHLNRLHREDLLALQDHLARIATDPGVVALPHLGASTREAEENCAVMVVDQLRDYLEHGHIANAVNFPSVSMARESAYRVAIANANVPNMLAQISSAMAGAGLNIHNMVNKSRGEMAYTLVDVDSAVQAAALDSLARIAGVLAVRYLPDTPR